MKALNPLGDIHLGDVGQTYLIAFFEKDIRLKHTHCTRLDCDESCNAFLLSHFAFFFFFLIQPQYLTKSFVNSASMHYSWTHKFHFSVTFSLKIDTTILFIYLKNYFVTVFSVSATISSIQTDPLETCRLS